jgi:hypothetical protein
MPNGVFTTRVRSEWLDTINGSLYNPFTIRLGAPRDELTAAGTGAIGAKTRVFVHDSSEHDRSATRGVRGGGGGGGASSIGDRGRGGMWASSRHQLRMDHNNADINSSCLFGHTLGQVFLHGDPLTELQTSAADLFSRAARGHRGEWFSDGVSVWASFGEPPASGAAELTVRSRVFAPHKRGLAHIHVIGFVIEHGGNQFPDGFFAKGRAAFAQSGLLGTRTGLSWVIENNTIRHAKTIGLDIGSEGTRHHPNALNSAVVFGTRTKHSDKPPTVTCESLTLEIRLSLLSCVPITEGYLFLALAPQRAHGTHILLHHSSSQAHLPLPPPRCATRVWRQRRSAKRARHVAVWQPLHSQQHHQ